MRGAYIVRYASRRPTGATDTIRQGEQAGREPLRLYSSRFGFRQLPPPTLPPASGTISFRLTDYSYRVVVPATSQQFAFSELETATDPGKGCYAGQRNTRRRFVLNGPYTAAAGIQGTLTYLSR